jgi:hypothetical protein
MAKKTAAERYAARKIRVALDAHGRQLRAELAKRRSEWAAIHIDPFTDQWAQIVEQHNPSGMIND